MAFGATIVRKALYLHAVPLLGLHLLRLALERKAIRRGKPLPPLIAMRKLRRDKRHRHHHCDCNDNHLSLLHFDLPFTCCISHLNLICYLLFLG